MLHQIFAIALKDLKILFRDRGGMITLFAMPVMFILVMSIALQGVFDMGSEDNPIELLVVNQDQGILAGAVIDDIASLDGIILINTIDGKTISFDTADSLVSTGDYPVALIFPNDFSARIIDAANIAQSNETIVSFIADPTTSTQFLSPIRGTVQGYIQQTAAYAQAPYQIQAGFDTLADDVPEEQAVFVNQIGDAFVTQIESDGGLDVSGSLGVRFEQIAPSEFEITEEPDSVEQNVPGYTIFGVFFIVQVLATSLLSEKQNGTFRRLLAAPLSKTALLLGKLLPYYVVNLLQVVLMFGVGVLIFDMNLGNSLLALVLVTLVTAAAATGMGLLVASFGKTPEQIGGLSTLLALTLAAIGGMLVPTFVMPGIMQMISKISPHAWALAGYQDVIVRGLGVSAIWNEAAVLMGFALVFFSIAVWRFRFD
ncbi:MAG: ABC-2 transporter permease [Anaerolineaceae bacterium]|nr:ABC-2 transporter permease [Anaerolineaceae bacterium]